MKIVKRIFVPASIAFATLVFGSLSFAQSDRESRQNNWQVKKQEEEKQGKKTLGDIEKEMAGRLQNFRQLQANERFELAQQYLNRQDYMKRLQAYQNTVDSLAQQSERKFFVGIQCEPALETQVKVPGLDKALAEYVIVQGGLQVNSVVEGGPAQRAGIEVNDIIFRFGKNVVTGIDQFSSLVDEVGEKEVSVVIIRGGKFLTKSMSPSRRKLATEENKKHFQDWIENSKNNNFTNRNYKNWWGYAHPDLPAGHSMTYSKSAGKTGTITIVDDKGNKWTAPANQISKLPKQFHKFAMRFEPIAPNPTTLNTFYQYQNSQNQLDSLAQVYNAQRYDSTRLSKNVDELKKLILKLNGRIDELEKRLGD